MLHISKLGQGEAIFERVTISGAYEPIAIERLVNFCVKTQHPIQFVQIQKEIAIELVKFRGIDRHKLLRLRPEDMFKPLLFVEDMRTLNANGGYHDLWDGHHRYIRMHIEGWKSCKAWIVKPVVWRQYIVEGLPNKTAEQLISEYRP